MYGAALLPACFGAGKTLVVTAQGISFTAGAGVWFLAGAAVYLVVHLALWKPLRVYIFGHELVHALSALLCGGSVAGMRVNKTSGAVNVSKVNAFIALSPYVVPIYAVFAAVGWLFARYVLKWNVPSTVLLFLLGFCMMFHLVLTLYAVSVGQSDFQVAGWLLSLTLVFIANCGLLVGLFLVLFPSGMTPGRAAAIFAESAAQAYTFVWRSAVSGWRMLTERFAG